MSISGSGPYHGDTASTPAGDGERLYVFFGKPCAFAGLREWWGGPGGMEPIESCTILTTDANELASEFHSRMPVILDADDYEGGSFLEMDESRQTVLWSLPRVIQVPWETSRVPSRRRLAGRQGERRATARGQARR